MSVRYTTGKMKGELKTPEIRKLIKAHNILVSIKIPKGAKREEIIQLLGKKGYMVDHKNAQLRPSSKGKVKKLPVVGQGSVAKTLPKPKTAEEKKKAKMVRDKKKEIAETKAYEKRKAQVDAVKKIQQRRKKGNMGKVDPDKIPEFDSIKKLEKYYMSEMTKFKKEVVKFLNRIKGIDNKKDIQKGRKELRMLGIKKVTKILQENDELFDNELGEEKGTKKYEELEKVFDDYMDKVSDKIQERIKELKK